MTDRSRIRVIAVGVVLCAGVLVVLAMRRGVMVPAEVPEVSPGAGAWVSGIDPNVATAGEIEALPGVGPSRARAIVAYREGVVATRPTVRAFETADDLRNIRGIGPAVVEGLRPHVRIPAR